MKQHKVRALLTCVAIAACGAVTANGTVQFKDVWASSTPPTAQTGAAYFVAEHRGSEAARLIGAASPVAKRVELHTHILKDGVMMMRKLDGIDVNPGEPLVFKPGSHHVMLMGLNQPLKEGQRFPLTLKFEGGGEVQVTVHVRAMGDMPHGETDHSTMDHTKP